MNWLKNLVGQVFGCLVLLPLMFIAALAAPLWMPIARFLHWRGECHEIRRMKAANRFIDWTDLKRDSRCVEIGTLIFEQAQKCALRLWWTPDDIKMLTPHPLPIEEDIDYLLGDECQFMTWLQDHYTGSNGKAFRTQLTVRHAAGFAKTSDLAFTGFKNIIPAVRRLEGRARKAAA